MEQCSIRPEILKSESQTPGDFLKLRLGTSLMAQFCKRNRNGYLLAHVRTNLERNRKDPSVMLKLSRLLRASQDMSEQFLLATRLRDLHQTRS